MCKEKPDTDNDPDDSSDSDNDDDDDDCPIIYDMGGDSEMLLNKGVSRSARSQGFYIRREVDPRDSRWRKASYNEVGLCRAK